RCGLALDRREIRLLRARDVEQVLELEDLAAAQFADRRRQQSGDIRAQRGGEDRRLREEIVAGKDRGDVRPARVYRRYAAPGLGLVDDVVVVERSQVHELDRGSAGDDRGRGGCAGSAGGVA